MEASEVGASQARLEGEDENEGRHRWRSSGRSFVRPRLRRLDETAEIVLVERGPYVSYANCGLPYHVGGVIEKEASLPARDAGHVPPDVRHGLPGDTCEVVGISAKDKRVELKDRETGEVTTESYDKLVLSPGAASIHPPLPGSTCRESSR